jgi:hypothetical protein
LRTTVFHKVIKRHLPAVLAGFLFLFLFIGDLHAQYSQPPRRKKRDTFRINPYLFDSLAQPIPMGRVLFHDKIDKEQQKADDFDGKTDNVVKVPGDSTSTAIFTRSLIHDVDRLQIMVENFPANGRDAVMENQQKIQALRALWELMRIYNGDSRPDPVFYKKLVNNMHDMLVAINENKLMAFAKANPDIYTLNNGKVLFDKQPEVRAYVYTELGKADPMMMIKRLEEYSSDAFAPAIIAAAAHISPNLVFNYATSTNNALKNPVYRTKDPLVEAIVKIASTSKAPLKAFPFLTDIYMGRMTVAQVDALTENPDRYFMHLVRLRLESDSVAKSVYTSELQYRSLREYVRKMNELHEEKDAVRFRCIDSLPATALYFIMVYGQDEIYTSSFIGTFRRMMERMKPMTGNQFLDSLHYDHFRTFIRMCAGYNTLSDFLGTMDDTAKVAIMTRFIGGLQNGKPNDLEDAVDVADAFGSIKDTSLTLFLQKKVRENYEQSYKEKSKKGVIVYSLLAMLFESNKTSSDTGAALTSARLRLPPINVVPFRSLVDDSGIVYQQVFFYGDDDGKKAYDGFIEEFRSKKWKITTDKYWSVISSTAGQKVVIYANLPLKEPEDEVAQDSLAMHLRAQGIRPTIVVHRGHSYHLSATLGRLDKYVKIVVLGSCGGYHNLAVVLDHSPDAHIISSKQTGVMAINQPITNAINNRLLEGADINWITMWRELDEYFSKRKDLHEKYDDYVPPYKNLGAIFIKAYRQMNSGG